MSMEHTDLKSYKLISCKFNLKWTNFSYVSLYFSAFQFRSWHLILHILTLSQYQVVILYEMKRNTEHKKKNKQNVKEKRTKNIRPKNTPKSEPSWARGREKEKRKENRMSTWNLGNGWKCRFFSEQQLHFSYPIERSAVHLYRKFYI